MRARPPHAAREISATPRPVRRGPADGIARGRIDGQVVVGAPRAERIVARRADLGTRLPPAMLANHDAGIELSLKRARARMPPPASRHLPSRPRRSRVACGHGMHLHLGIGARWRRLGRARCWVWQNRAGLAQVSISGNRAARSGSVPALRAAREFGQRRVPVLEQGLRVELDPSRRRGEAAR